MLDSYVNFNITGSMTFTSIDFRGENALATPVTTYTGPPMATLPVLKCTVSTTIDSTNTAPTFTLSTTAPLTDKFTCEDSNFSVGELPMVPV